ncbi:hypothetical protein [Halorubrum trueperi]|uniref:Amidohydrolase-related domain-containing protein n=1 Tax=Halorubrum trueperi TaxID=2004704 RepID=A0ABD5UKZ5_9EURY
MKFQCPVQDYAPDATSPDFDPAFELAAEYDRPVLFHPSTAPMYEGSPCVGADHFRSFCGSSSQREFVDLSTQVLDLVDEAQDGSLIASTSTRSVRSAQIVSP